MNRIDFVKQCGTGCLTLLIAPSILQGCAGVKYLQAPVQNDQMTLPLSAFKVTSDSGTNYLPFVVAENQSLKYPIAVYRSSDDKYNAVWMRCTHRGHEVQAYADKFHCPAHGSEFSTTGAVEHGPADQPLKTFAVVVDGDQLKINLAMS